jgi:hypothetical protein
MTGHKPFRDLVPRPVTVIKCSWLTVERTRYKRGTVREARVRLGPFWCNLTLGTCHVSFATGWHR